MLGILAALLGLDFARAPLWLVVLALGVAGVRGDGGGDRRRHARGPLGVAGRLRRLAAGGGARARARPARSPTALYDLIRVISAAFPFRPAMDALDAAISGGELLAPAAAPRRARARLRRARAPVAAALRVDPPLPSRPWPSPPPACAGCARRPASATSCARPSSRRATSSTRCSSSTAAAAARRSPRCRASTTSRSTPRCARRARRTRSGIPAVLLFGLPAVQGRGGLGRVGRRGRRSSSRRARSRPPTPTCS